MRYSAVCCENNTDLPLVHRILVQVTKYEYVDSLIADVKGRIFWCKALLIKQLFFLFQYHSDIDECAPKPCQNGGTCTDGINEYTCTCAAGYTDNNCQTSKTKWKHFWIQQWFSPLCKTIVSNILKYVWYITHWNIVSL